ncbi:hypothetical protein GCM10010149_77160 [Nonomuraea roseoviolacea subsp. roseoviolacea]|uniref:Uncharacterized protein YoxC n=1 Tax=Nonomuraea roseoviolacea subsp. carminata TaxID=160689 RepID=A0ABT1KCM8_9ACTN|nr:DUF948 domain-containing protein [Nonomuraea roseoviolacea]MCP2350734.1 uncharacterized protein YoxC [Nonomuraea roseoviolacea subsp. carminata]
MLTAGEVAGLIAATGWIVLVCVLTMVLVRLARLLTETTRAVSDLSSRVAPLLDDVSVTVNETNRQLVAVEAIAQDLKQVSGHAAKLSAVTQTIFTGPLIKVSSLVHGVRRAIEVRRPRGGRATARPAGQAGRRSVGQAGRRP